MNKFIISGLVFTHINAMPIMELPPKYSEAIKDITHSETDDAAKTVIEDIHIIKIFTIISCCLLMLFCIKSCLKHIVSACVSEFCSENPNNGNRANRLFRRNNRRAY